MNPPQTPVLRKSTTSGLNLKETFCTAKEAMEQEEKLQAAMVQLEQQKAKRAKKTQQVENQLSLFDSVA